MVKHVNADTFTSKRVTKDLQGMLKFYCNFVNAVNSLLLRQVHLLFLRESAGETDRGSLFDYSLVTCATFTSDSLRESTLR